MRQLTRTDRTPYFDQACSDLAERSKGGVYIYFVTLALYIFLTDYHQINPFMAYAGLTFQFGILLVRITLFLKFKEIFGYNSRLWHLLFRLATLAVAVGWSIFWITVLRQDGMSDFFLLGLITTVGTVSGGTATLSSDQKLVLGYQTTMLLPLSVTLLIQKTNIAYGLAATLFLGIFLLTVISRQFYEEYIIRLDAERDLVDQTKKLKLSQDKLEIRVQERTADIAEVNENLKREITEHKQTEEERLQALQETSSIMETVPDLIYVIDLKGRLINWNKAVEKKTGYAEDELKNKAGVELFHPDDIASATDAIMETFQNGYATRELRMLTKGGKSTPHFFSGNVKRDDNGNINGLVGVSKDITELKQLERQLQQAKKMEAIGLLAGGVAHDLNNILSGIVGYPELILKNLPRSSELRKPLEAIQESGNRAAAVVADLLTVARGAAISRDPYNLNSIIEEYLDSPEYKKLESLHPKVRWQHQLDALQPYILCSSVHIKKSFMNLATNAAEAIVGEGDISVTTSNRHIDEVASAEHDIIEGDYIALSVCDTGPGISKKDLDHIFDPFYSKKIMGRSGTGLGLTIVWNVVQEHGGKIFVESSNKGTCFKLYFPVSKEKRSVQAENDAAENDLISNGEYILVVDDEPQMRDLACQMLQRFGYKTNSVHSGELAIEFVKKDSVDLIVIDMKMEPGMNGRQTYEEIIRLHPNQKAIITSGFSESDDVKATLQLGASSFIKKPYSMDQLGRAVRDALNS